jgi:hypothetical protein
MSESAPPEVPAAEVAATDATCVDESTTPPQAAEEDDTYGYGHLDDLDLQPFRIHPLKVGDRLSAGNLQIPIGLLHAQKRFSLDSKVSNFSSRSRSRSPSLRSAKDRATITTQDGNSSLSSLEEFVDSDILYDKLGFVDYDKDSKNKQYLQHSHSYTFGDNTSRPINLTPVSERMSEDTLEDVHAFSDLSANTNTRASSSVGTGGSTSVGGEVSSHILEPLDEGDEDLESSDDENEGHIIVTNLENISLQQSESVEDDGAKTPKTDTPSVPMA